MSKCGKKKECSGEGALSEIREKYLKEQLEIIKTQMNSAMRNMHELNTTNIQLIRDLKELKKKCMNVKEEFVDQKINELHCYVNLTKVLEITRTERRSTKDNTTDVLQSKLSTTINNINDELDGLGDEYKTEEGNMETVEGEEFQENE